MLEKLMMLDWYAEPGINESKSVLTVFEYVNSASGGLFFAMMLLVIWIVTFIATLFSGSPTRPGAAKGWIFASFFTSVLGMILVTLNLMNMRWMYVSMIFLGIGAAWLILENASE